MGEERVKELPRSRGTIFLLGALAVLSVTLLLTTVDPWLDKAGFLVGGLDAHVYRDGALRILEHRPLYTEPSIRGLLYTYTPFSTIVFLPIVLVPWSYVTNVWLTLNVLVLIACVRLAFRMLGYRSTTRLTVVSALLALGCVFLEPVRTTLYYGQINLMLMLLVLWDFSRDDGDRLRGTGVGIAAGIKLVPGFFIFQFAVLRQWRTAVTAAAVFLATIALAWVVLPADSRQYWLSTFMKSDRIADDGHPSNQSLRGALAHVMGHPPPVWLWLLVAGVCAVAGALLAKRLYDRGERLLAVVLSGMTACAISPFSWGHHWVWFVPLLVYIVHRALRSPRWWLVALALYVSVAAWTYQYTETWVSVGVFLLPPTWPFAQIFMNAYVIVYAVTLGAAWWLVRRSR
ncbi:glycosyltransferase 87 family protein [Nocardia sp. NPDC050406]|uniref:glycosyltransferase 87 family protein n=1 Tax=Nocardia sp. NPDC050406 TaxID=3364318 RepID=UPI00379E5E0F